MSPASCYEQAFLYHHWMSCAAGCCAAGCCATGFSDADDHSFYPSHSHSVGMYHFLSDICHDSDRELTHNIPWTQKVGEALHHLADRTLKAIVTNPGLYYYKV
jgi:hypothetical protein